MTDWFVHDPAEGRVGPLSTNELRERYRQRRVQRDTLVWHAGMREWQALDRVSDQVGIDDVVPDASLPPPLPPSSTPAATGHATYAAPSRNSYAEARQAPPARGGLSGCAIALIVLGVLAIPLIGILAAIALPAYQDYTIRAKVAAAIAQAKSVQVAIAAGGACPTVAPEIPQPALIEVRMQPGNARCAFLGRLQGVNPNVDGAMLLFTAPERPGGEWTCDTNLPTKYAGRFCVADSQ